MHEYKYKYKKTNCRVVTTIILPPVFINYIQCVCWPKNLNAYMHQQIRCVCRALRGDSTAHSQCMCCIFTYPYVLYIVYKVVNGELKKCYFSAFLLFISHSLWFGVFHCVLYSPIYILCTWHNVVYNIGRHRFQMAHTTTPKHTCTHCPHKHATSLAYTHKMYVYQKLLTIYHLLRL